jgi:RNA polymerase sigma factor (sigma-70 family)
MEPPAEDYSLALKARGGDPDAVAALIGRTRVRLFAVAHHELGNYDDAQDAVAAAILQVCLHIRELREPERVVFWMQSIVLREARRLRREQQTVPLREEDAGHGPNEVEALLLRLDISQALRRLPGQQAQALRLFYMDGLSVREVATALGMVSEGTAKVWLHRGRRHLAAEMKGYALMSKATTTETTSVDAVSTTPPIQSIPSPTPLLRPAAILHTDLTPDLLQAVSDALRSAGFTPQPLAPSDLPDFRADQLPLRDALRGYEALVVDETVGGRSGLEYVLFCRAHAETANIPITLLHSQEENALLITACYAAGVSHLARRDDLRSFTAALRTSEEPKKGSWEPFTERARQIVCQAQREAIRLGENCVSTEHLLLGLVNEADSAGARILVEKLNVPLERVVAEVERQVRRGAGRDESLDLILTPRSRNVVDYAQEEAVRLNHRYIGSEHLLLGLLREDDGLAARVLAGLGVTLERVRDCAGRWQVETQR